jgi:hypothetical protein
MALDLGHILTRERVGGAHDHRQHLVDQLTGSATKVTKIQAM